MTQNNIILIGAGGHCRSCIEVIENAGRFKIRGIIDKVSNVRDDILEYSILGDDTSIPNFIQQSYVFLITVGQIKSASIRKRLFEYVKQHNGCLATVLDPTASVSKRSDVGEGTIVCNHAVINSAASIGCNSIINTNAVIEHDCEIGHHTHISTGAVINGGCFIGDEVLIGSNSVILQGVNITSNVVVGAGSVVLKNIAEQGVYAGNPARKIHDIEF